MPLFNRRKPDPRELRHQAFKHFSSELGALVCKARQDGADLGSMVRELESRAQALRMNWAISAPLGQGL